MELKLAVSLIRLGSSELSLTPGWLEPLGRRMAGFGLCLVPQVEVAAVETSN